MKKNVLITGVTGTIARQLAHKLYYDNRINTIIGIANEERPYYFNEFDTMRFKYSKVDILRSRDLNNLFLSIDSNLAAIDTVIHCAFITNPHENTKNIHTLNVIGTKNILDKCLDYKSIKKFIFLSSGLVYKLKGSNDILITENHELNFDQDRHPLIKDLVDAEFLCRAKMDNPHMKIVIIRPSGIIGRNIKSHLNLFLESFVSAKIMGYDPMINPIHSLDVMSALQLVIFKNFKGIFNIAGLDIAPLSEFIKLTKSFTISLPGPVLRFFNLVERKLKLTSFDLMISPESLKYNLVLDITKAKNILAFNPKYHIKFR
jgi:UDP-glucose 4-epimerase